MLKKIAILTVVSIAGTNAASADLVSKTAVQAALSGKQSKLNNTNVTANGTTGAVVTNVEASDGKVTVTKGEVKIPSGGRSNTGTYAEIWVE